MPKIGQNRLNIGQKQDKMRQKQFKNGVKNMAHNDDKNVTEN